MKYDSTKVLLTYITLKSSLFLLSKKEELLDAYLILLDSQYIVFWEKIINIVVEMIEFIVSLNL